MNRALANALIFAAGCGASTAAQPAPYRGHQLVEVELQSTSDIEAMLGVSGDFWAEGLAPGRILFRVPPERLSALEATGLPYVVLDTDLQERVDQARTEIDALRALRDADWFVTYRDLAEIEARLDEWAAARPDLVSKQWIGQSIEGRPIHALRIADASGDPNRPIVLLNGTQHAREWLSPMTLMYIADQLIERSLADADIADLLRRVEFIIVPVTNPDGYVYSGTSQPYWRKNRRMNANGTRGVDLNRNWEYGWGGPGSSATPSSETYRGTAPFSEPETQALRDLILAEPRIALSVDVHSFGNQVLRPWGNVKDEPAEPDRTIARVLGGDMQRAMRVATGTRYHNIVLYELYLAAGNATDWNYSMGHWGLSIELPGDDFIPSSQLILPTGIENFAAVVNVATRLAARVEYDFDPPGVVTAEQPPGVSPIVFGLRTDLDSVYAYARNGSNGAFEPVALATDGSPTYAGALPALPCGDIMQYYFTALDGQGREYRYPDAAPAVRFAAWSLAVDEVFVDDMEADRGWSPRSPTDTAPSGAWTRVVPNSPSNGNPGSDHSADPGSHCWMTQLGSADVDGGSLTLTSPVLQLADAPNARVEFWRWFSNHSGPHPLQDVMRIETSNNGVDWVTVSVLGPQSLDTIGAWIHQEFRVADYVTPTDAVQVRFVAVDDGPDSQVEAGLDDFRVYAASCASDCAGDATRDGIVDLDDLVEVLGAFGRRPADDGFSSGADFDRGGRVDLDDLLLVLGRYGASCP